MLCAEFAQSQSFSPLGIVVHRPSKCLSPSETWPAYCDAGQIMCGSVSLSVSLGDFGSLFSPQNLKATSLSTKGTRKRSMVSAEIPGTRDFSRQVEEAGPIAVIEGSFLAVHQSPIASLSTPSHFVHICGRLNTVCIYRTIVTQPMVPSRKEDA